MFFKGLHSFLYPRSPNNITSPELLVCNIITNLTKMDYFRFYLDPSYAFNYTLSVLQPMHARSNLRVKCLISCKLFYCIEDKFLN